LKLNRKYGGHFKGSMLNIDLNLSCFKVHYPPDFRSRLEVTNATTFTCIST